MRSLLPLLLTTLLLAGCADGEGAPSPGSQLPTEPTARLRVGFPARGLVDTIEVDAVDRLPLRAAELVAPDGTATAAGYINVDDSPSLATGQAAAGNPWPDGITGNNSLAALNPLYGGAGTALRAEQQLLAIVSTAEITLPDAVAYRRDWRKYHLRLSFGTPPGEVETQEIAAPAPPPQ